MNERYSPLGGTKVIFRKFQKTGEVIALFPGLPGTAESNTCASYMHVGQHGAADVGIVAGTTPATHREYAALKRELRQIGYLKLRIVKRFHPFDRHNRAMGIFAERMGGAV